MNIKELYPNLITTVTKYDDYTLVALRFDNGKPGAMIARIATISPVDGNREYLPYPAGDVTISFEAGKEYVADTGTLELFVEAIKPFCQKVVNASNRAE